MIVLLVGVGCGDSRSEGLDLNGLWSRDDGRTAVTVRVDHLDNSITATVEGDPSCPFGGSRNPVVTGTISSPVAFGASLTGDIILCERQETELRAACGWDWATWSSEFTAEIVDADTISGTWVGEWWEYDHDDAGNIVNCHYEHETSELLVLERLPS
jgi:hypothetical protein